MSRTYKFLHLLTRINLGLLILLTIVLLIGNKKPDQYLAIGIWLLLLPTIWNHIQSLTLQQKLRSPSYALAPSFFTILLVSGIYNLLISLLTGFFGLVTFLHCLIRGSDSRSIALGGLLFLYGLTNAASSTLNFMFWERIEK